ncbi:MAG TPA: hypothetical protein PKE26_04140 [Kiritimatiellia bacterium]|nr:hypothetical protein [Kiritimatiellia bacterium]HMO98278.1 hypothetical protein [Kiritimatiellia bacterium]HMP96275.1 hypothetical protein [Kiritimatiellia bacterium]
MNKTLLVGIVAMAGLGLSINAWSKTKPFTPYPYHGEPLVEEAVLAFRHASAAAGPTNRLRVAFYNIEMFFDGIRDGKHRDEAVARNQARGAGELIDEIGADILLIAEIENERALGYLNEALENPYPKGYIVQFGTGGSRREKMNIALLTRYRPESVHEIDFGPLTGEGRPTRGIFRAVFDLGDGHALLVYASHLKSNWGKKMRNYSQRYHAMHLLRDDAARMVAAQPERQWEMVLLSDVNTDPLLPEFADDPTLRVLSDWHDLWLEHPDSATIITVPTRYGDPAKEFPPALFDRVLVNPGLREAPWTVSLPGLIPHGVETGNVQVLPGHGAHISDHYPVFIDIER